MQKNKETFKGKESPPKTASPKRNPPKDASPPKAMSPPKSTSPPKKEITSPPTSVLKINRADSSGNENSVAARASRIEAAASPPKKEVASPPKKEITSPPVATSKLIRSDSKAEENKSAPKLPKRENSISKDTSVKADKVVAAAPENAIEPNNTNEMAKGETGIDAKNDESVGVGDKIKKFEKAFEDSTTLTRPQRSGSVRRKDNAAVPVPPAPALERQHSINRNNSNVTKWPRNDSQEDRIQKPEPQKIIKPEFKPAPSPVDFTIRSPSLGAKAPDRFPSHGTAFRNVASPDQTRADTHRSDDDLKPCKLKNKEKYSVSKGSSYFTRGSEEIWLVKKKDIEEIEERVLDSFRRAGAGCGPRPEFSHTMGRGKRQMYARSESLDPQWAGARAQTLKRQTSVACTCGHDKKPRAKSAGGGAACSEARPRARSHGDEQPHVLDKYETLV